MGDGADYVGVPLTMKERALADEVMDLAWEKSLPLRFVPAMGTHRKHLGAVPTVGLLTSSR